VLALEAARPCRDDGNLSGQVLVDHAHTLSNAGTPEKVPRSGCRSFEDARGPGPVPDWIEPRGPPWAGTSRDAQQRQRVALSSSSGAAVSDRSAPSVPSTS